MRTTISIDDELLAAASAALGIAERTAVLHEGLRAIVQREAARRLARLGGSDGAAAAPARRRPRTAPAERSAKSKTR